MAQERRRRTIRLELTERQREQVRRATGRVVTALELRLQDLEEPAAPLTSEEEHSHGCFQ